MQKGLKEILAFFLWTWQQADAVPALAGLSHSLGPHGL